MSLGARYGLGKFFSEGARQVWVQLELRSWRPADLRLALDGALGRKLSSGVLSRWMYGECRPSLRFGLLLQDILGVEPRLWNQVPAEPFEPPALAEARRALEVSDVA